MSPQFILTKAFDPAHEAHFNHGLDCLFLFEKDPAIGSARVAKARLYDLGEEMGLCEDVVDLLIDTSREGGGPDEGAGVLNSLAVLEESDDPVVESRGALGCQVLELWAPRG